MWVPSKALILIEKTEQKKGEKLTKLEVARTVLPAYMPAVVVGYATIVCILGVNLLCQKQQASLASAYALLNEVDGGYKGRLGLWRNDGIRVCVD